MKNIDKRLFTILMIVFVQMVGMSLVFPILPLYAKNQFNVEEKYIPMLFAIFFVAQLFAGPILGRWSDKVGRLPILIISQIGTAISFVMLGLAQGAWMLFASRILDGATGGNIIVAQAYITDIVPEEKRTESLGYIFAAFGLGFMIGPALGGELSARFGPQVPFYLAAVAATLTIILTWAVLDESLTPEQKEDNRNFNKASLSFSEIIKNYPLVIILLVTFVGQFVLGLIQGTFALYSEAVLFNGYTREATSRGIGLLLTSIGVAQFLTQTLLLRRLLRIFGEITLIMVGSVLRGAGMFVLAMITNPWLGPVGSVLFAMGMGLMMPPLQSLSTKTVAKELRGGVLGVYNSAISLSTIFSLALSGVLFERNPTFPYWVGGVLALLVLVPALFLTRYSLVTLSPQPQPTN